MKKLISLLLILPLSLLILTSCASKTQEMQSQTQNFNNQGTGFNRLMDLSNNENLTQIELADLLPSKNLFVMGQENSDGSITAQNIIMSETEFNFENLIQTMTPPDASAPNNANNEQSFTPPAGTEGQRPNWQNISDDERQQLREQMMANGEPGGNFQANGARGGQIRQLSGNNPSMARINGEILSIEDQLITLKVADNGSKLIFTTDETKIFKVKNETNS